MSDEQLARVQSHIATAIKGFCKTRLQVNALFFMEDLRRRVSNYPGMKIAPASPDRILRNMRTKGIVSYEVVNRAKSLYKVTGVV